MGWISVYRRDANMLVFLSGPMDRANGKYTWVDELEAAYYKDPLVSGGVQFFSPQRAFMRFGTVPKEFSMRIREINEAAVRACSAFVLRYEPGVETWGCPMELMLADQLHKPIMVWLPFFASDGSISSDDEEKLPIYIQSCLEGRFAAITIKVEGVLRWIARVGNDSGPEQGRLQDEELEDILRKVFRGHHD